MLSSAAAYPTDALREKQLRARVLPPELLDFMGAYPLKFDPHKPELGDRYLGILVVLVRRMSQVLSSLFI